MTRFYVTTPIYYVNDVPHLGTAYTTIAVDAARRYRRLRGDFVRMLTGTDEHGLKIEREAQARGKSPLAFADEMSAHFRAAWPKLEIGTDDFIRTTEARHEQGAQEIWERIKRRNPSDIYLGEYEDWYCVGCEEYKTEKDLIQPGNLCALHRKPVERLKEETYFFRLSRYEKPLLEHYAAHPQFVEPESRRNEVLSFVQGGLRDLSISRTSFKWGIPVPGSDRHVLWVWFDALPNYWTALQDTDDHKAYWAEGSEIVHIVGKDILRFHAVYWPAILLSAGLALPSKIFAHGFLTYSGQKMSKSLRNAVEPLGIAREFGRFVGGDAAGADVLRYQLLRAIAFGQDGDFDLAAMIERYNADLGKNIGNLLSRTLSLCVTLTEGKVPEASSLDREDEVFRRQIREQCAAAAEQWASLQPHRALESTLLLSSHANVYIDQRAPWADAKKGNVGRAHTTLALLIDALECLSVMLWPVLPTKSDEMRRQLGLAPIADKDGAERWPNPNDAKGPSAGRALARGASLFPTIDEAGTRTLIETLTPRDAAVGVSAPVPVATHAAKPEPEGSAITYDAFSAIDLRVGVVLKCERVAKKDKLLKLAVDLGEPEPRTIVAGLALSFAPESLVGRRVVVVANLAPREFGKGLSSHGMILASGPSEALKLATVEGDVEPGARLK